MENTWSGRLDGKNRSVRLSARPVADRRIHQDEIVRAVVVNRFRRRDPVGGALTGMLFEISLASRGVRPTACSLVVIRFSGHRRSGNSAYYNGGGATWNYGECCDGPVAILNNCIVYYNTARIGPNHDQAILHYSCTTPLPANGAGNITNAPLFLNQAAGNLRLQSNSPCTNAGLNAYARGSDLDGRIRILGGGLSGPYAGGTVDMVTNRLSPKEMALLRRDPRNLN